MTGAPFMCPYCGAEMRKRESEYGPFWSCSSWPDCDARVGARPDGTPLGTPANAELRAWRTAAHRVFDPLWRKAKDNPSPPMTRADAYHWLGRQTAVAHIAQCEVDDCFRVIQAVYLRRRRAAAFAAPWESS